MTAVAERPTSDLLAAFRADPKSLSPEELKRLRAELKRAKDVTYEKRKDYQRGRQADISRKGRDIAPIPEVVDPERRALCERDFRDFLYTYFPHIFTLPFSPDHLKVIAKIERVVLEGDLYAVAMPRGSGKTVLCECACIWSVLYAHRPFVVLLGPDQHHAERMLKSIKVEIQGNEILVADFPEVCYPFSKLENIANRAAGQICNGEQTHLAWSAGEIVLPTIPGSKSSGCVIKAAGLNTASVRGTKHKRWDGSVIRPTLFVADDCQTDASAASVTQCEQRERVLAGAVLGMAGPGKKIAGILPCTVIREGDVASNMLDRKKHPLWQGERFKLVYAWSTDQKRWDEYAELRAEGLRTEQGISKATEYYRAHRSVMDAGAVVAWQERYNEGELSALQHAVNLRLQNPQAFAAEMQNEPLADVKDVPGLTVDQIISKVNNIDRGIIPLAATHLVGMIDVQQDLLYYLILACADDFTGAIVDYGAYPDQHRPYFSLREARPTLASLTPGTGLEGVLYAGLTALTAQLLGREWKRENGSAVKVEKLAIDANWDKSTETVYTFCRQSPHAALLLPSHGRGVGAKHAPMGMYKARPGERLGECWTIKPSTSKAIRYLTMDVNHWKSMAMERLAAAPGSKGGMMLFGSEPAQHRLLSEHLTSEKPVRVEAMGRTVDEWMLIPNRENHFFDCLTGCLVLVSVGGAKLHAEQPAKTVKAADLQRAAKRFGVGQRRV